MSKKQLTVNQCQFQNARGQRCNMVTTADEVNLFLGNLVRQLARKRIARRDAIALAYMSQLLLNTQTAMAKEAAASEEAEKHAAHERMIASLYQGAAPLNQSAISNQPVPPQQLSPSMTRSAPRRTGPSICLSLQEC